MQLHISNILFEILTCAHSFQVKEHRGFRHYDLTIFKCFAFPSPQREKKKPYSINKTIWFIQALATRLIPMILFMIAHAIGEVYIYNWDPLQLIDLKQIPRLFDSYLFLYIALGLIIVILFFMNLPIIARVMTVGILASQVLFFLHRWDIYIYGPTEGDPYYDFYMRILLSIIAGFILQVMWRLIKSWTKKLIYIITVKQSSRKQSVKKIPVKK